LNIQHHVSVTDIKIQCSIYYIDSSTLQIR